jgi:uncharacterized protein YlxW (UPF0749 family)
MLFVDLRFQVDCWLAALYDRIYVEALNTERLERVKSNLEKTLQDIVSVCRVDMIWKQSAHTFRDIIDLVDRQKNISRLSAEWVDLNIQLSSLKDEVKDLKKKLKDANIEIKRVQDENLQLSNQILVYNGMTPVTTPGSVTSISTPGSATSEGNLWAFG